MPPKRDYINILFLGASGTGKTTLIKTYDNGSVTPNSAATIGLELTIKKGVLFKGQTHDLKIWENAGHERFRIVIRCGFYRVSPSAVIILYDVTTAPTRRRSTEPRMECAELYMSGLKSAIICSHLESGGKLSFNETGFWTELACSRAADCEFKNIKYFMVAITTKVEAGVAAEVTTAQGEAQSKVLGMPFFQVNAKSMENVNEMFDLILNAVTGPSSKH